MADTNTRFTISAVDQTGPAFNSITQGLSGIKTAAETLGVTLSAVAMIELVRRSINAADELAKLSRQTGNTVEDLSGLKFAAEQNATSLETVAHAAKKLSVSLVENKDMFAQHGITATNSIDAMVQLSDIFSTMPDGIEKTTLAMKIFGKSSGPELIEFMSQGSASMRDYINRGKELSNVNTEAAGQAKEFNDQIAALTSRSAGAAMAITNKLLPALLTTVEAYADLTKSGKAYVPVGEGLNVALQSTIVLAANTAYVFKEIGIEIGGIAAQTSLLARGDFSGVAAIHAAMIKDGIEARKEIDAFSERILNPAKAPAQAVAKPPVLDGVAGKSLLDNLKDKNGQDSAIKQLAQWTAAENAKITIMNIEAASGEKLGESYKALIKLNEEQKNSITALTAVEYLQKSTMLDKSIVAETRLKQSESDNQTIKKLTETYTHEAESLKKKNAEEALRHSLVGQTVEQQAALRAMALDKEITDLQEKEALLAKTAAYDATRVAIEKLIEQKKIEKGLTSDPIVAAAAAEQKAMQVQVTGQVTSATTGAFFADNGKSFTENFTGSFKSALEPAVDKLVAQLITSSIDTGKATVTSGDWVMAIIAAVSTQFGIEKSVRSKQTDLTGTNAGITSGSNTTNYTRSGGWFGQTDNWSEKTALFHTQIASYNAAIDSSAQSFVAAGNMLGYADAKSKSFSTTISTAGDVTNALAQKIGSQLTPAIVLFQREGENLDQTAQRLTTTFKTTNDLINAVGISSDKAFAGFGLQSAAARDNLIAAAGGLQAFSSSSQSYIKNFLTPAQQLQPALDDVAKTFNNLGISGVSTNAEFAALVKAQLALGNTSVVGQLMTVADSFNTITKSASDANSQLNALLNKDNFTTLVDYKRAMALNGAGSIANAQLSAAQTAAQDQAATASFTQQNAAAIALANFQNTPVINVGQTSPTDSPFMQGWNKLMDTLTHWWIDIRDTFAHWWTTIADTFSHWWTSLTDTFSHWWSSLTDTLSHWWTSLSDGFSGLWTGLIDAIRSLVPGVGGNGMGAPGGNANPINWFSDPRLKENITPVGVTNHGLTQYDYSYKADKSHQMYRGVMSDEVRRVMPSAVSQIGGFDRVDYAKLGIKMQKLSSFDIGTNYVPHDMVAKIHSGEEITPRPYVDLQRSARDETNALLSRIMVSNAEMATELTQLRAEVKSRQKELVDNSKFVVHLLDKFDGEGMPPIRVP